MPTEEMIEVRVTATQKVRYSQIKKIKKTEYEKYEKMCDAEVICDRDFNTAFDHLIDYSDVSDADDLQDLNIEAAG